ncbi:MAG: DUF1559 domain-containing protein [Planctomycetota bacterium]
MIRFRNLRFRRRLSRYGFTLIELLVGMTIAGILAALTLPAVQSVRESSRKLQCHSRLRQVSLALSMHESQKRFYPPGRMGCSSSVGQTPRWPQSPCAELNIPNRLCGASALVPLLPYLEQDSLFRDLDGRATGLWVDNLNNTSWYVDATEAKQNAIRMRPGVFSCPSSPAQPLSQVYAQLTQAATADYAFCQGTLGPDSPENTVKYDNDGMFVYGRTRKTTDILDGLSNTIFIGEVRLPDQWESSNIWTYGRIHSDTLRTTRNPINTPPGEGIIHNRRNGAFGSQHPGGASFAFGDGRVQFVSETIDQDVYNAAAAIRDGQGTKSLFKH